MAEIRVDKSAWPYVETTIAGAVSEEDVSRFLTELRALHAERKPFGHAIDLSNAEGVDAKHRARIAQELKAAERDRAEFCVAVGFVVTSPVMRGTLTAVSWLQSWPYAVKYCATLADARDFVKRQLRDKGPG